MNRNGIVRNFHRMFIEGLGLSLKLGFCLLLCLFVALASTSRLPFAFAQDTNSFNPSEIAELRNAKVEMSLALTYKRADPRLNFAEIIDFAKYRIDPSAVSEFFKKTAGRLKPHVEGMFIAEGILPEEITPYYDVFEKYAVSPYYKVRFVQSKISPNVLERLLKNGLPESEISGLMISRADPESVAAYLETSQVLSVFDGKLKESTKSIAELVLGMHERNVCLNEYKACMTHEPLCKLYPPDKLVFKKYRKIKDKALETDEKYPLPFELKKLTYSRYHSCFPITSAEKSKIYKEIDKKVRKEKHFSLTQILESASQITGDRITYKDVDATSLFSTNCSLATFWDQGVGDCDKYAALFSLVFDYYKGLYPEELKNTYVFRELFGRENRHAWNTLVIVEKNQLTVSYLDPTFADNGGKLNALDSFHFDKESFLREYEKLCKETE